MIFAVFDPWLWGGVKNDRFPRLPIDYANGC